MKKSFWAAIAAVGGAIIAAFLYVLSRKPTPVLPARSAQSTEEIQKIQNKTDQEILQDDVAPAQHEQNNSIVEAQVNEAIASAGKYRRKKQ